MVLVFDVVDCTFIQKNLPKEEGFCSHSNHSIKWTKKEPLPSVPIDGLNQTPRNYSDALYLTQLGTDYCPVHSKSPN